MCDLLYTPHVMTDDEKEQNKFECNFVNVCKLFLNLTQHISNDWLELIITF
jgi:hypothetical protein